MSKQDSNPVTRRQFVGTAMAGAGALLGGSSLIGTVLQQKGKLSACDRVQLGGTKIQITRLGVGTGTRGGKIQRDLGAEGFTKLFRHAYERGVRYIDTADAYKMHDLVRQAIKGLPREELVILSKMKSAENLDVPKELDRFRKELGVEYLDIVLIHCMRQPKWPADMARMRDALSAAKEKGILKAHGVSCHGLPALREVAGCGWVEVNLARINNTGVLMDGPTAKAKPPADRKVAEAEIRKIREAGKGVLAMKVLGEGAYKTPEEREKSIQYVVKSGLVDAMTIGFKSNAEVDEAIERIDRALNG